MNSNEQLMETFEHLENKLKESNDFIMKEQVEAFNEAVQKQCENVETEIGRVCIQLASPDFKFMTGETITLEGGLGQRP